MPLAHCTAREQVNGRDVVRCECGLVQFVPRGMECVRCHISFMPEIDWQAPAEVASELDDAPPLSTCVLNTAGAVSFCRKGLGLTQVEFAARAGLCR